MTRFRYIFINKKKNRYAYKIYRIVIKNDVDNFINNPARLCECNSLYR